MVALAVEAAEDKKAEDVVVLDLRDLTLVADYFVICSASSMAHIKAVVDAIEERMTGNGCKYRRREGSDGSRWVLLDYGQVVAHVFHHTEREYYDLERLWGDARRV